MRTWQQVTMRSKLWPPACYSVPKSEPIWSVFSIYNVFSEHKVRLLRVFFSIHSVFSRQLRLPACYCAPKSELDVVPTVRRASACVWCGCKGTRACGCEGTRACGCEPPQHVEHIQYREHTLCREQIMSHPQTICMSYTYQGSLV